MASIPKGRNTPKGAASEGAEGPLFHWKPVLRNCSSYFSVRWEHWWNYSERCSWSALVSSNPEFSSQRWFSWRCIPSSFSLVDFANGELELSRSRFPGVGWWGSKFESGRVPWSSGTRFLRFLGLGTKPGNAFVSGFSELFELQKPTDWAEVCGPCTSNWCRAWFCAKSCCWIWIFCAMALCKNALWRCWL